MVRRSRRKSKVLLYLSRSGAAFRWGVRLFVLLLVVDLFYLALTWPDWKALASGPVPKSSFIRDYEARRAEDKSLPVLHWQPIAVSSVPKPLLRAVVLAEDARFYQHSGFDLAAFKDAMNYNLNEGRFALGASTISQQTVKNLFLTSSRNPLRKWHELVLTWGMERHLSKRRILELYLNLAEFGHGVYGVQAAARAYWGVPASALTIEQAVELVACLPSPGKHNPATRTAWFEKRARKIYSLLVRYPGEAADSVARELGPPPADDMAPVEDQLRDEPPPSVI